MELPGYDLVFMLTDYQARSGQGLIESIKEWRDHMPQVDWVRHAVKQYNLSTHREIGDKEWRAIMAWQWLKRLAPLADLVESKRFDYHYLEALFQIYANNQSHSN